jgi:hypothetical protein
MNLSTGSLRVRQALWTNGESDPQSSKRKSFAALSGSPEGAVAGVVRAGSPDTLQGCHARATGRG